MIINTEIQNLIKKINEYEHIIIAKHVSPDWDAQGSALGLQELITTNFAKKQVYVVGRIFNSEASFADEAKLTDKIISQALLITVDVANFERIDFAQKTAVKEVFKIDHHIQVDDFAPHKLVDEKAISCTQVVAQWAQITNLKVTPVAATYLYYGLITDSGRFLYKNTSQETFAIAGFLLEKGVKIDEVYDDLYLKNLEVEKWLHHAFTLAVFDEHYPIAFLKIKLDDWKDYNITEEEVKMAISVMGGIKQVAIWLIAYESLETSKIKVSIRSRKYEINKVAAIYQGGGHKLAAGAKVESFADVENIINDLKKLIDNKL